MQIHHSNSLANPAIVKGRRRYSTRHLPSFQDPRWHLQNSTDFCFRGGGLFNFLFYLQIQNSTQQPTSAPIAVSKRSKVHRLQVRAQLHVPWRGERAPGGAQLISCCCWGAQSKRHARTTPHQVVLISLALCDSPSTLFQFNLLHLILTTPEPSASFLPETGITRRANRRGH